jgi:thioredoxin 2
MNINVVCPHCLKVNSIEKKASYSQENCAECQESLLEVEALSANMVIVPKYVENSDIPVIVDFWAPSCGPCMRMKPLFAKLATELPLQAQFLTVNTDSEQSMVSRYNITSIPTFIAFKEGKEVDRVVGAMNNKQLGKWIRSFL